MDSTRQQKVARLIQKDMAELLRSRSRQFGNGVIISVTVVRITPDMGMAKIYLSVFPSAQIQDVFDGIVKATKSLRYDLGRLVGKQLRIIPELRFYIDDSLDYAEKIDKLLK